MSETMFLLAVIFALRTARWVFAWQSAIGRERARAKFLADIVRLTHNRSVVCWRADGELLIIPSAAWATGKAA